MKTLKNIFFFAAIALLFSACVENNPKYNSFPSADVAFTYCVSGDEYTLDYLVVTPVQFTNTSAKASSSYTWDFGDGETSTEENPIHKYAVAGQYKVKLTLADGKFYEAPIMIADIAPKMAVSEVVSPDGDGIVVINDAKVTVGISIPNPESKNIKYTWTFPDGTTDESGNVLTSDVQNSSEQYIEYPKKLSFKNVGSQKITLKAVFDTDGENRELEESYVNVQVGVSTPCPTLYYAVADGNIMAYKLVQDLPTGSKNLPFDLGVKAGNHPQNLLFCDGEIYVLDCGRQYSYINTDDETNHTAGDGKIQVIAKDGSNVAVLLSNVGGFPFRDPYTGYIDYNAATGAKTLYYTDRNTGIRKIDATQRNVQLTAVTKPDTDTGDYLVMNNWLGYYSTGAIVYGSFNGGLARTSDGTFWWCKYANGNGILRFTEKDIDSAGHALGDGGKNPYDILLTSDAKAILIDEERDMLYLSHQGGLGSGFAAISKSTLEAAPATKLSTCNKAAFNCYLTTGTEAESEQFGITQLALDKATGNVYFCFRKGAKDDTTYKSGVLYYNPTTGKFATAVDGVLGYGCCVNNEASKLF